MKLILCAFSFLVFSLAYSQEATSDLPYYEIPDYPEEFTAGTVAARMVDALGFRYYWATEGLTENDLEARPNKEGRNTLETVEHIYGLSQTILNSTLKQPNERGGDQQILSFEDKRKQTLFNLKQAADILKGSVDISQYLIVFKSDQGESSFPFWNQINGPIADAIWHCGQIASMRRSTGNPFNSKVNHFTGKINK